MNKNRSRPAERLNIDGHLATTIWHFLKCRQRTALSGRRGSNEFGPLDETRIARIEVIIGANVEGLFHVLDTIEIKVENRSLQHCAVIFVDDGKSGRVHDIIHAEGVAECFDKSSFSCAHLAIEGKDITALVTKVYRGNKFLCRGVDAINGFL